MKATVLLADPPWRYRAGTTTPSRAIERHYPTMSLEALRDLPVATLAAADAALFLWATAPKLVEALAVMTAWGFDYRSCFIWHKSGIGMGHYWRIDHELLLLGIRGKMPAPAAAVRCRSVLFAKKKRHSAKPWEVYRMIESMYPAAVRLELFAREPAPGWEYWGAGSEPHLFSGEPLPLNALMASRQGGEEAEG